MRAENNSIFVCKSAATCNDTLSAFEVRLTLTNLLLGQPDFPHILELLAVLSQGDGPPSADGSSPDISMVWGYAEVCSDLGLSPHALSMEVR
jgi:hypothetical protein